MTRLLAWAGLAGALAAIALPSSTQAPEIACILAVSALAILAGHQWGVIVLVAADIALLGRVWPLLLHEWPPSITTQNAIYTALAGALPGLFVLRQIIPHSLEFLLGRQPSARTRTAGVGVVGIGCALWLVVPALLGAG